MAYQIVLAPEAVDDFRRLSARYRAVIRDAMERHLRDDPEKVSRTSIKRLRGIRKPRFRLRVDDFRVFYDVSDDVVAIVAIVHKPDAERWLEEHGEME